LLSYWQTNLTVKINVPFIQLLPIGMWETNKSLKNILDELSQKEKKITQRHIKNRTIYSENSQEKDDDNPALIDATKTTTSVEVNPGIATHYVNLLKKISRLKTVLFILFLFSNLITLGTFLLWRKIAITPDNAIKATGKPRRSNGLANTFGFLAIMNGVIPMATTLVILR